MMVHGLPHAGVSGRRGFSASIVDSVVVGGLAARITLRTLPYSLKDSVGCAARRTSKGDACKQKETALGDQRGESGDSCASQGTVCGGWGACGGWSLEPGGQFRPAQESAWCQSLCSTQIVKNIETHSFACSPRSDRAKTPRAGTRHTAGAQNACHGPCFSSTDQVGPEEALEKWWLWREMCLCK